MAIEIIPKPAAKIPLWLNILFYFSIALLIVAILSLFVLTHFIKKSADTLQNLEIALAKKGTPSEIALEEEIFSYQKKIEDIVFLINFHQASSQALEFLEKVTHPKVWFSNFSLNLGEPRLRVSGSTENFQTLGQQLLLLKGNSLIKEVNLSGVLIGREGKISFTLDLLLDTKIFRAKKYE